MNISHSNLTLKIFTISCLCALLSTSLRAMENRDKTTDSTSTQMVISQFGQEKLIDHFTFKCDLVNENPEISVSD